MKLLVRVASGVVLVAIIVACLALGKWAVAALVVAGALAGAYELTGMAGRLELTPPPWVLVPLTVALTLRAFLPSDWPTEDLAISGAVVIGLILGVVTSVPFTRTAVAVALGCYLGLGLGFFGALYVWPGGGAHLGVRLVVLALIGPIVGDSVAYLVGSAIGRHHFFPAISPNKSVEGAVAAALATIGVYALVASPLAHWAAWQGALMGVAVTVAAQGGDLAESALKRQAKVKDSSHLIPGHGGVLDRLDSLLLVAPVVYWCARLVMPA